MSLISCSRSQREVNFYGLFYDFQISNQIGENGMSEMCRCNSGIAKANVAIEGGSGPVDGQNEAMMNTFYRTFQAGFGAKPQGNPF